MARRRRCPLCGSLDTMSIAYGYPVPEMLARHSRGEFERGGCCIDGGEPDSRCRSCGEAFGSMKRKAPRT
jgi:hypothetical protein